MIPRLTIAIPTFNRSNKIKKLYEDFLSKVIVELEDVEIIICDNSDFEHSEINKATFIKSNIRYIANETNIGYPNNLIRCLSEATGEFVWIVSDDDDIEFDAFCRMTHWLKRKDLSNFNAIMLPFYNFLKNGERYIANSQEEWGGSDEPLSYIVKRKKKIPFILFSSAIIRNQYQDARELLKNITIDFGKNDFIQIPLYISIIGINGNVTFYDEPLQEYRSPNYVRFSLIRMVESMEQVLKFISDYYGISSCQFIECHYQRWMSWLVSHRSGNIQVKDGDAARWFLLKKWFSLHFTALKHMKLFCLVLIPKSILKKLYFNQRAHKTEGNKYS
jgi:glycosyltransferase involved in cell wall biosynthesis